MSKIIPGEDRVAIRCESLSKHYGSADRRNGLCSFSTSIRAGSIAGLVGANGAGKTTLLSLLARLRRPTGGTFALGGRAHYLADVADYDPWLRCAELLDLVVTLQSEHATSHDAGSWLELVGLEGEAETPVGDLSRGMTKRLGLAACLVGDPDVILMDEPLASLDPPGRRQMIDLVGSFAGERTVLFSSHDLDEIDLLCDHIIFLEGGKSVFDGTIAEVRQRHGNRLDLTFKTPEDGRRLVVHAESTGVRPTQVGRIVTVQLDDGQAGSRAVLAMIVHLDLNLVAMAPRTVSVRDLYFEDVR